MAQAELEVVLEWTTSEEMFFQKLETILPETRNMTNADCLALLMGDDPPQEIENLLYRFLTSLFRRRLGILAAQGEGLRGLAYVRLGLGPGVLF